MNKKLHEEALEAADRAVSDWSRDQGPHRKLPFANEVRILGYLAHLKAHGWKLTPREPSEAQQVAGSQSSVRADDLKKYPKPGVATTWHAMHDAAPDFPGESE